MKPQFSQELKTALHAAEEATKILLEYYKNGSAGEVTNKGKVDRVSQADYDSESVIRKIVETEFPEHSIVGEELGINDKNSEFSWYIDPLCGSNDFIHGFPDFGLSIALTRRDKLVLGVCSLPAVSELYWAEDGFGAFLNHTQISVSRVATMEDAIITTHFSAKGHGIDEPLFIFKKIAGFYIKVPGSFPYSVCNLARGRTDIHVETQVTGIHSFAARKIAEEAGGKATKLNGAPLSLHDAEVLITNGLLHDKSVELFSSDNT